MFALLPVNPVWDVTVVTGALRIATEGTSVGGGMMGTILAWTAPVAAAAALVGLWRYRDDQSRHVWSALAMLVAVSSAAMLAALSWPIASRPAVLALITMGAGAIPYGTAALTGVVALLWEEYRRDSGRRPRRGDHAFWSEITRELTSEDSLDTMLLNVAGAFRRQADAEAAHVFKISRKFCRARRIGTVGSEAALIHNAVAGPHGDLLAELAWWAAQEQPLAVVHDAHHRPLVTVPVRDGGQTYALMLVQNPRRPVPTDWIPASALVARQLSHWCELAEHRDRGVAAGRMTAMMPCLLQAGRLEAALSVVDGALKGIINYDYLSLSALGESRAHEDRVTMLSGSQRVTESRRRWPIAGAALRRVLALERPVITPDLDMAAGDGEDDDARHWSWERRLGMRSRLIAPVRDGHRVIGTVTLAHRRPAHFDEHDIDLLETVAAFLAPWMRLLEESRVSARQQRVMAALGTPNNPDAAEVDDEALIRAAAEIIDATGIRVFRLDAQMRELHEVGAAGHFASSDTPRRLALAQLPWHRWALESRRTLTINQGDPESIMDAAEAALAMDRGMKTGRLVPIHRNGLPLGVIDVIERRHPDRATLDSGSRLVLDRLAAALGGRWGRGVGGTGDSVAAHALCERLKGWSRQIVNPLTTIIGSVELIRLKATVAGTDTAKYLGNIERSATRIHTTLMEILEEAAVRSGDEGAFIPRERWHWVRERESAAAAADDVARPASLAGMVSRRAAPDTQRAVDATVESV